MEWKKRWSLTSQEFASLDASPLLLAPLSKPPRELLPERGGCVQLGAFWKILVRAYETARDPQGSY